MIVGSANRIWTQGYPADAQNDDLKRRRLYVALTRATETATVVYSGSGPMPDLSDDVLEFERAPSGLSELSAARSGRSSPYEHGEPVSTAKPLKPAEPETPKPLNTS